MKVSVALIFNAEGKVLITQRPEGKPYAGYWEFPGGKLDAHETPEQALDRELQEELGIRIVKKEFLGDIEHQYPDKKVHLHVFKVPEFEGIPRCLEGQTGLSWYFVQELPADLFLEANQKILKLI